MRTSRLKANGLREASKALSVIRRSGGYAPWSPSVSRGLVEVLSPGYYRYARGKMIGYAKGTSLSGAMTSARIAASRSREKHMLFEVKDGAVTLVRTFDKNGKTTFRIEEY